MGLLEKIAMFINILGYDTSNWKVQEIFLYLGSTLNFGFQEILAAIWILHTKYIQPKLLNLTSNTIFQNWKYNPYFNNYIDILDRRHIAIYVPNEKRKPYWN